MQSNNNNIEKLSEDDASGTWQPATENETMQSSLAL